jgi:hypothetical protein
MYKTNYEDLFTRTAGTNNWWQKKGESYATMSFVIVFLGSQAPTYFNPFIQM